MTTKHIYWVIVLLAAILMVGVLLGMIIQAVNPWMLILNTVVGVAILTVGYFLGSKKK